MRLRRFLGWMLALGLAGCGGGGGSSVQNAAPAAPATAKIALSLDVSRITSSTSRRPDFVGAGITNFNVTEISNGQLIFFGSGSFTSCPAGGPCTAGLAVAAGSNLTFTVNVTNGSTTVGTGSNSSPITVAPGSTTPVPVQINPVFYSGSLAVTGTPSFVADGTGGQTATITFKALDPLGNVINTSDGPVNNWPTITFFLNDSSGNFTPPPPPITSPPATNAGSMVTVTYNGGPVTLTPANPNLVVSASGSGASNIASIPVIFMYTPSTSVGIGSSAVNVAVTETNSNVGSFGLAAPSCAGDANIGAPSYAATGPGGLNETATYSITAISAFINCSMTVSASDFPLAQVVITLNGPGSVQGTIQSKREHH